MKDDEVESDQLLEDDKVESDQLLDDDKVESDQLLYRGPVNVNERDDPDRWRV